MQPWFEPVDDWRYSSDHKDESMGQTVLITLGAAAAYIVLSVGLLMWCRCKRRQHKMQSSAETGENATDNAAQVALCECPLTSVFVLS